MNYKEQSEVSLQKMRHFYELFPYPNRPLFLSPSPQRHLNAHGGFAELFRRGRGDLAQRIWEFSRAFSGKRSLLAKGKAGELQKLLQAHFPREKKILLAGCGTDEPLFFRLLHPQNPIVAIDLSKNSIRKAKIKLFLSGLFAKLNPLKKKWGTFDFIQGDACKILRDNKEVGTFDYIQCFGVLHHQQNPEELFAQMVQRLNAGGVLRLMVYSYYGRKLERRIQQRYSSFWKFSGQKQGQSLKILFCYLKLRLWQSFNFFAFFKPTSPRFRYLGLGSTAVADALMHPSDPGFSLEHLEKLIAEHHLSLIYCEAKLEDGLATAFTPHPENTWQKIREADKKGSLLSNPVLLLRKGSVFE